MINWKARVALAFVAIFIVLFGYWLSGGEFSRGQSLLTVYLICLGAIVAGLTCPIFDDYA